MIKVDIDFYNRHGWVLIKQAVPLDIVNELKVRGSKLREWVEEKVGTPSEFGPLVHWKGVGCAGMYDEYLLKFYQSSLMFDIVSQLLNSETVYKYNDQMVVKLPDDDFGFDIHADNEFGNENKDGSIHTVNMGVALDDFTDMNGTLEVLNIDDEEWVTVYPQAGDIIAINGNTKHCSSPNCSEDSRGLYACVYSEKQLNHANFYRDQFTEKFEL